MISKVNRITLVTLSLYIIFQALSVFTRSAPQMLLLYEIFYLIALFYSFRQVVKSSGKEKWKRNMRYFVVANVALILIYIPLVILNPKINWMLEGRSDFDPMLLIVIFPPVHLIIAIIFLTIAYLIARKKTE